MNGETKRHIDAARQVLVGVVPNPISQIDQITNALIYKFMDDMDQAAIKAGGKPSFFVGDLEKYAWTRLMDSKIGSQERMNLYAEGFIKLSEAKKIPELFRSILKSAYLPHRSPEVLDLFLREINYFDYSHPEELGNAYEYLLSIMSSQGDIGSFRTPRNIIDFIVAVVNPNKDEKILDPACGTAGFLISAYRHILSRHDASRGKEKPLTPDQKRNLMSNFEGYDIDPGMVRIAQVNMYLHQFKDPKIFQYDSLSSDERWGDKFDVILANPPFMSPKGGIRPHSKFSIKASKSEVLFVDYIMSHLRPKGRAGIIVPEGIIFQSKTAYKQLRKKLVEDGLYSVVSLPSGIFNPYSGVKTSILFFDNELSKQRSEILFIKVDNDGLDLGAQRRPIDKNDLPEALEILHKWHNGEKSSSKIASYVSREKIAEGGEYNLSADRYGISTDYSNAKWPMVKIDDLCNFLGKGQRPASFATDEGQFTFIVSSLNTKKCDIADYNQEALVVGDGGSANVHYVNGPFSSSDHTYILENKDKNKVYLRYIYLVLSSNLDLIESGFQGQGLKNVSKKHLQKITIPLPPLEIQKQIVEELDSYQKIISGAQQVVDNWKPRIDIDPKWEKVKFSDDDFLQIVDGDRGSNYPKKNEFKKSGYCLFLNTSNVRKGKFNFDKCDFISKERDEKLRKGKLKREDIVLTTRGTLGNTAHYSNEIEFENIRINSGMVILRSDLNKVIPKFLLLFLNSSNFKFQIDNLMSGSAQPQLPIGALSRVEFLLPPIEIQKDIVKKIDSEVLLIDSNKKLIDVYKQRIKEVIAKIWEK